MSIVTEADDARLLLEKWVAEDCHVVGWLTLGPITVRVEGWLAAPEEFSGFFLQADGADGKHFIAFDLKDCLFGYQEIQGIEWITEDAKQFPYCLVIGFPNGAKLVLSTDEASGPHAKS
jgi:hypothetical protein